jgi:hypothetical protein
MIKNGVPVCNYCNKELVALTKEEALADGGHGWHDWRDALVHSCNTCFDRLWDPPCGICETHPCERGNDCWASPPLHIFPYETYFADRLEDEGKVPEIDDDFDLEEPLDLEVRQRQIMLKSGQHPNQQKLMCLSGKET